jgi:hypothetical protein
MKTWTIDQLQLHLAELQQQGGHLKDYELTPRNDSFSHTIFGGPTVEFKATIVMPRDWVPSLG